MNIVKGNLVELIKHNHFDVVVHGCNCFNTMGISMAKELALEWPVVSKVDNATVKADRSKLGTFSTARISVNHEPVRIINAYTRYGYEVNDPQIDFTALRQVLEVISEEYHGEDIVMPILDIEVAGTTIDAILEIVSEVMKDVSITIVLTPTTLLSEEQIDKLVTEF